MTFLSGVRKKAPRLLLRFVDRAALWITAIILSVVLAVSGITDKIFG